MKKTILALTFGLCTAVSVTAQADQLSQLMQLMNAGQSAAGCVDTINLHTRVVNSFYDGNSYEDAYYRFARSDGSNGAKVVKDIWNRLPVNASPEKIERVFAEVQQYAENRCNQGQQIINQLMNAR